MVVGAAVVVVVVGAAVVVVVVGAAVAAAAVAGTVGIDPGSSLEQAATTSRRPMAGAKRRIRRG